MTTEPIDHPNTETVKVRQGTGPRATFSVLFLSLIAGGRRHHPDRIFHGLARRCIDRSNASVISGAGE